MTRPDAAPLNAIIATAGHVDHGKSTLVRALTNIEPDRWKEERERGLTIDLGFAWTQFDNGRAASFVDVPGHQRFIGNMLAGVGPAAAVMFVVAADEGWRQQSTEHLLAIDALGIRHGLLVLARSDLADPATRRASLIDARERIAKSSLGDIAAVTVSARTGDGIPQLRHSISALIESLPGARPGGRSRMWIDRAFTMRGAGTVVTGTLGEGSLRVGDRPWLVSAQAAPKHAIRIRGLQSLDRPRDSVAAIARAAVNLADVTTSEVGRGDVLLTGDWALTAALDVRLIGALASELPTHLMAHVGTYAGQVRIRPLGGPLTRLHLPIALPLVAGDRLILRNPGTQHIVAGAEIVDADPPALRRRGAAAQRAQSLAGSTDRRRDEVERRGAVTEAALVQLGVNSTGGDIPGVRRIDDWLVSDRQWTTWVAGLAQLVADQEAADPLEPSVTEDAAARTLALPQRHWLIAIASEAGAQVDGGRVQRVGAQPRLGAAEVGLVRIEAQLAQTPWRAPEQHELDAAGLGSRELAAAVRLGRIIRLPGDIVLLADAPARAMRVLTRLPATFTTSEARLALQTTRRVAIPLLEHLDARGWTRRLDNSTREVAR